MFRMLPECATIREFSHYYTSATVLQEGGDPYMHIGAGSRPLNSNRAQLQYCVSITDPCIDGTTTQRCLPDTAAALTSAFAISA